MKLRSLLFVPADSERKFAKANGIDPNSVTWVNIDANAKLSALKAIASQVNYSSADLEYVNLMNPAEAAVGYKSLEPKPTPGAPQPSPTPAATCK